MKKNILEHIFEFHRIKPWLIVADFVLVYPDLLYLDEQQQDIMLHKSFPGKGSIRCSL